jgi:hypothetical protein
MLFALAVAAAVGLAVYIPLGVFGLLEDGVATLAFNTEWYDNPLDPRIWLLPAFFGYPISLIFSVAVGLPIWKFAESKPLRSNRHAVMLGALVGFAIGLFLLLLNLLVGLDMYLDDNSGFSSKRFGRWVIHDGLPTLFGWIFQVLQVLYFTIAGVAGGVAARWAVLLSFYAQDTLRGPN